MFQLYIYYLFIFNRLQIVATNSNVIDKRQINYYRLGLTYVRVISIQIQKCRVAKGALLTRLSLANDRKIVRIKTLANSVLGISKREERSNR